MSNLRDRRNAHLLNRALARLAKRGKYPQFSAVFNMLAALLGRSDQGSMLDPALFVKGAPFPLAEFNKNLADIAQEFQILFDEAVYRASKIVESQVIIEEFVSEIRRQLRQIRQNTQRELLLAGSNFLDAIVIQFVNRDHIDLDNTTAEVDTSAGIVTLPRRAGARRVIPITIPSSPIELESKDNDAVLIQGSDFKSVFTDSLANWQVKSQGNFLRVRFSLGGALNIGRIQVVSPDDQAELEVRISPDGLNYIRVGEPQFISGGTANYLFESQDVRFIELFITKTLPPESNGTVFTLDMIAMYSVGYQTSAVLQTLDLQTETASDIKRATIDLDADIPADTYVDLEAAGGTADFRKVENRIVSFTDSKKNGVLRRATSSNVVLYSYSQILGTRGFTLAPLADRNIGLNYNDVWGIEEADFFGNTTIPTNIDSRYTKLYRENCWGVESKVTDDIKSATINMSMERGELRDIFVKVSDELYENGAALTNNLTIRNEIAAGQNMPLVGSEDSSIIKVTGIFNYGRWPVPTVGPFPEFTVTVHVEGSGPTRVVYTEDQLAGTPDYIVDYQTVFVDTIGDVKIVAYDPATRRIDLDPTLEITPGSYILKLTKRDLTKAVSAVTGKAITFSVQLREYEKVIVTYNTPIDGVKYNLIASSVRVNSSIDSALAGVSGQDYRVIGPAIEMMQGTSLPTDGAQHVPIRISFDYVLKESNFFSYWAYVVVPEGQNRIVKINPITLERDEKIYWADPSGRVVDMVGLDTLVLSSGIHRFSVIGIRGVTDGGELDPASALYRLANLTAADGGFVFDPNAQYIERITGYIEPMTVTNRFFLERGARKNNNTHFAWEDNGILSVLKLDKPVDSITIEPGNPTVVDGSDYRLAYRFYNDDGVDSIKVRVTLRRDPSADASKTPVIRGMTIRFTE